MTQPTRLNITQGKKVKRDKKKRESENSWYISREHQTSAVQVKQIMFSLSEMVFGLLLADVHKKKKRAEKYDISHEVSDQIWI